ncbi:DUF1684 domain-containing protein [Winogradskyella ursingii]|uniref:DUF1684 domain-containing protein n=1 Tax=Winogradskyella ursingii TaxID=2686079 RepID=UPI0015C78BD0|nr:DUF1684 domain-containing protein [Winogradskyella ursingii]
MKNFILLLIFIMSVSCAQEKQTLKGETEWQKEQNANFKDATKSPLKDKDRKTFTGLDFYKFDSTYVIKAVLKRTPDSKWFNMKTTTNEVTKERVYGVLNFELKGESHQLNVYQGQELMETNDFRDYLFLPFLDDTNGEGSYAGGRYVDLTIPEGDEIIVDFNTAYNPYCVYNEKYSCPIVPRVNYISTKVEAGMKAFEK